MDAFLRWYISSLKTHPMVSNMCSALVLMTAGDIMAQGIEIRQIAAKEENAEVAGSLLQPPTITNNDVSDGKRQVNFRRYGTMTPDVEGIQQKIHQKHVDVKNIGPDMSDLVLRITNCQKSIELIYSDIQDELSSIDFFRTGTMGFWAVAVYTPYFVGLYRLFDRFLPMAPTPASVMARVGSSFVASIPLNAAFFCYGSYVHHFADWFAQLREYRNQTRIKELPKTEYSNNHIILAFQHVPFGYEQAWKESRSKLDSELLNTIKASGAVWIPINIFNFSLMPPHLRPLTLMFCSAFWNCYLSLAQHRVASVELDN